MSIPVKISDIANSTTQEDFVALVKKYELVVDNHFPIKPINEQLIILDLCYKYINTNHKDLNPTLKSWCVYVIRKLYDDNKLTGEVEINKCVEDFITYHNNHHEQYLENIETFCSEYDRDIVFINTYLNALSNSNQQLIS
jgi:hypothetical protein